MKSVIEKTLKIYLEAVYRQDLEVMYDLLYEDDIIEYKEITTAFAEKMDVFGETEDFLKKLKIKDVKTLKKMSPKEFMFTLFKMMTRTIGAAELKRILEGTKIIKIDETDFITIVTYTLPVKMFDEWDTFEAQANMILTGGEWKFFFKSGLRLALQKFQKEIDDYYERKAKDQLENLGHPNDLSVYTLKGYQNLVGETVFEARFKDAGEFSEGFAPVKVMKKYGYINAKGDLAIKPQFLAAQIFSQARAAVKVQTDDGEKWGFINKKGKLLIPPQYSEVSYFSQGLCAVFLDEKWGYINKKGETKIPFKFETATAFDEGRAFVTVYNSKGELRDLTINKKGELK